MKKIKEISKINQELINKKEIKFGRSLTISEILEITNKFKFILNFIEIFTNCAGSRDQRIAAIDTQTPIPIRVLNQRVDET